MIEGKRLSRKKTAEKKKFMTHVIIKCDIIVPKKNFFQLFPVVHIANVVDCHVFKIFEHVFVADRRC